MRNKFIPNTSPSETIAYYFYNRTKKRIKKTTTKKFSANGSVISSELKN